VRPRIAVCAVTGAILALTAIATPVASARSGAQPDFVPVHRLGGDTGGELEGQAWANLFAIPAAQNPLDPANPARCTTLGHRRPVLTVIGESPPSNPLTCVVEAGTPLFFGEVSLECSDAEGDGSTVKELRACAVGGLGNDLRSIRWSLDGGAPVDIFDPRFEVVSPAMHTLLPEDPLVAKPGPMTFVAAAYAATPRRTLAVGPHTIALEVEVTDGSIIATTYTIIVIPCSGS